LGKLGRFSATGKITELYRLGKFNVVSFIESAKCGVSTPTIRAKATNIIPAPNMILREIVYL